jgi:hypothetical protein
MEVVMNDATHTPAPGGQIAEGTVVRDRNWGGTHTGTVLRREGRSVFVAWHGSAVEDELDVDEVSVWADAPAELAQWRGGIGLVSPDGYRVEPVHPAGGEQ